MNSRKLTLLMLPITVAFLVGGYAGSLVGISEFQFMPAIVWAVMIGIIDYNFSVIEKLSRIGWIGRILLIITSAVITATIGDHIIFKDTIAQEIKNRVKNNPKVLELKGMVDSKTIEWEEARKEVKSLDAQIAVIDKEITYEINNGGCYTRCNDKKVIKDGLERRRIPMQEDVDDAKESRKRAIKEWEEYIDYLESSHNIILEIQVLYEVIFSSFASMIIFILLSLMVICIETLPLLLKSGETGKDIGRKEKESRKKIHTEIIR